jgi:erythromycin esterase-like protein
MRPKRFPVPSTMNLLRFLRPQPHLASNVVAAILATAICASCAAPGAGPAATPATGSHAAVQASGSPATAATPLDRAVRDVCNKRIVLLGEDSHHGSGGTLAVKTVLVSRLIDECGFSAVLFEASLPEFVALNRAFAADKASPAYVADAIGGLWSVAGESDPLISALFERASRKHVVLAGLDGQIGSTNLYAQTGLADELAGYLADPRRSACQTELQRFARYRYDDASPFDDATRVRLRECLAEIKTAASGRARSAPVDEAVAMVIAWQNAIELSDPALARSAGFNARDPHPIDYSKPVATPWHEIIDGLLVLREEHPLNVVHDPQPRRASLPAQ